MFQVKRAVMEPIDYHDMEKIIQLSGGKAVSVPGGSTSNMLRALASFGQRCAIVGKVGTDEMGQRYVQSMTELEITPRLAETSTHTSIVLSMVTPDGERTMRTFMGASAEFHPNELDPSDFEGVQLFHVEGYSFYNEGLTERAMRLAKNAGAKVSLDLSSFEVVRIFKEPILHCLHTFVDIVLANEQEVRELSGFYEEEEGCDFLGEFCETVVVMMGKRGGWVRHVDKKIRYPAVVVTPIDTTGAGDVFTSGFLHGYLCDFDLKEAARLGAMAASMVVQEIGAYVPREKLADLLRVK